MKSFLIIAVMLTSIYADGALLFDRHCSSCHSGVKMSFKQMKARKNRLKAPPMNLVVERLKNKIHVHLDDEDVDRAVVVAFIKDYVMAPDIDKGVCRVNCFVQFGVMPSQKEAISMDALDEVAKWVYDNY